MKMLKIGELARLAGKSARAIRFYEELGLIRSAAHTKGGFRLFHEGDVRRIELVDKFHELGFPLEEIARIVAAYHGSQAGDEAHRRLRPLLEKSLRAIDDKVALLGRFRTEVESSLRFVQDCSGCAEQPAHERCNACSRGEHQPGAAPSFIDKLL